MAANSTDASVKLAMSDVVFEPWETLEADLMRSPAYMAEYDKTFVADSMSMALSHYRAQHGLSQTKLGKLLGMTQPQVCDLESGDHTPDFATIQRICEALGMEITLTIGSTQEERRPVPKTRGAFHTDASRQATVAIRWART